MQRRKPAGGEVTLFFHMLKEHQSTWRIFGTRLHRGKRIPCPRIAQISLTYSRRHIPGSLVTLSATVVLGPKA